MRQRTAVTWWTDRVYRGMKKGMELEIHNPIEQEILKECELRGQEPDELP